MKKLMVCAAGILSSMTLLADTYYWIANDPNTQVWADATDLSNWSTVWAAGNVPDPAAHPTRLPTSSDTLWYCRNILMDLNGQSLAIGTYQNGKKFTLNAGGEFYGTGKVLGFRNGTISISGTPTFRHTGGVEIEKDAVVTFANAIIDSGSPIAVRNGGNLTFTALSVHSGSVTVYEGGTLTLKALKAWSYASGKTTVENNGTLLTTTASSLNVTKDGGDSPSSKSSLILRQKAGSMTVGGTIGKQSGAAPMGMTFELVGGTLKCTGDVTFTADVSTMSEDADATVEVADGKTVDMTPFTYGSGAKLTKTGDGTITFATAYPAALDVSAGTANFGSVSGVAFSSLTLGAGSTTHLTLHDFSATELSVDSEATVTIDTGAINVGTTVVTSSDDEGLEAMAEAINASLGDASEITAKVEDGAVVIALAGADKNTLEVKEGTMTWSAWVAEHGAPSTSITLVKTGAGTLVVDTDLSDYTGGIRVDEGTWKGSIPAHFGPDNGEIRVTDTGAALEVSATTAKSFNFAKRKLFLKGTGVNERGALVNASTSAAQTGGEWGVVSGAITLEGDTLIRSESANQSNLPWSFNLDMNGYDLTLSSAGTCSWESGSDIANPGTVVLAGSGTWQWIDSSLVNLSGTGRFRIRGTILKLYGKKTARDGQKGWTIEYEKGYTGILQANGNCESVWSGAMEVNGQVNARRDSGASFRLDGQLTGSGTIFCQEHPAILKFTNANNAFEGSFSGMGAGASPDELHMSVGTMLPTGKSWSGSNSLLDLTAADIYSLPSLTFGDGCTVTGGAGTANKIVKNGSSELVWNSLVGGPLDVRGGFVSCAPVVTGLWEGRIAFDAGTKDEWRAAMLAGPLTQRDAIVGTMKYAASTTPWTDYMIAIYEGYLWNNTDGDVTWNVHLCIDDMAALYIDGERKIIQDGWTDLKHVDVTLSPGPHRFVLNMLNNSAGKGPSTANGAWKDAAGNPCSTKGFAIKYSAGAGASSDDYEVPGASLFTPEAGPVFSQVKFAEGTYLTADGQQVTLDGLETPADIRDGDVLMTGTWEVSTKAPSVLTVGGRLTFAADAQIAISGGVGASGRVLATAAGGIEGVPTVVNGKKVRLEVSADGKSLLGFGEGLAIILK